jgi:hypothetical protein
MGSGLEGQNIHIEKANKLDGISNYQTWKVKMKAFVQTRKFVGDC